MKTIIFILTISSTIFWSFSTPVNYTKHGATPQTILGDPPTEDAAILDSIIAYTKETSVNRDKVNWVDLSKEMKAIHTSDGLIEATKHMLKSLEDFHGRIWKDNIPHNGLVKEWVPSKVKMPAGFMEKYQRSTLPIHGTVIQNNIGYMQIPGIGMSEQDAANAKKIRATVLSMQQENDIKGWIIDLRLNGGGTMFPMVTGLSDFFKNNEEVGSFIDRDHDYKDPWLFKDHDFYFGDYQATDYHLKDMPEDADLTDVPVVVLISQWTASSGEVVAIAFKNRPNTYFIGENTSGYTTAVSWQPMSDNIVLQVTTSYYADRLEHIYKATPVKPDQYIEGGDNFEDLENDQKIISAIEWME